MRKLIFTLIVLAATMNINGQNRYITKTDVLRNEKWWGVYVGGNMTQPFAAPFEAGALECDGRSFTTSMMVSSLGRYFWSADPMEVSFDGKAITVTSDFKKVEAIRGGKNLREAYLACYHKNMRHEEGNINHELFTRPVYRLQIETGATTDQQAVTEYADRIISREWPVGTILIPDGWQSLARSAEFNPELYPDPAKMVAELHKKGFKVMVTATPYLKAAGRNYIEAKRRGDLMKDGKGNIIVFDTEAGYQACLDVTRQEIAETLAGDIKYLKNKYALDGFLFESAEILGHISEDKDRMLIFTNNWNAVGKQYEMAMFSPAVNMPASGYVNYMSPRGDISWETIATSVNDAVNAGLCGYIYSHFAPADSATPETDDTMLLAAIQLALMMPIAVVPPSTDLISSENMCGTIDAAVKFRGSIGMYIEETLSKSNKTAEPLVRHMEYQFPGQGFANCNDQFMLGTKYLVVIPKGGAQNRTVRLPRGMWTAPDGKRHRGPRVVNVNVKNGEIIYFTLQGK